MTSMQRISVTETTAMLTEQPGDTRAVSAARARNGWNGSERRGLASRIKASQAKQDSRQANENWQQRAWDFCGRFYVFAPSKSENSANMKAAPASATAYSPKVTISRTAAQPHLELPSA